ncbi:uncharacterized protein MKK02DRAFT_45706 [Dioszegia hungarica]|uniref:Uncharacterized protein n=1 Tax=Dioszegia hungarica TaxID=4972 RepID=A0AA38HB35_9TREE|nr:uncharacterized protein MKK02DRAFT_45706 [Dioszegia hungarica]KAI9636996.1 hypothetical protein MKK02DRAFT_45706 [Dioszegia hungarica]
MPARGGMPGAGAPDHGGDARGVFSNPLMFKDTFQELSSAFTKAIHAVEDESRSGVGSVGKALVDALKERRAEIDGWLQGKNVPGAEGGEKNDDVTRKEDKATGLYAD